MPQDTGRQSPRLISDSQLKQMVSEIHASMESVKTDVATIREDNEVFKEQLVVHGKEISELKAENVQLKSDIKLLNENVINLEQYSRKDVVIVTGLVFNPSETQRQLEDNVTDLVNKTTGNSLTNLDFVAIHRNSRTPKNNRPPTVTIKFLRFSDKDRLFTKRSISSRKQMFAHINFHHCLCPALIEVQRVISADLRVKFVRYDGPSRHFTVCLNSTDISCINLFLNRIRNYEHFKLEVGKIKQC